MSGPPVNRSRPRIVGRPVIAMQGYPCARSRAVAQPGLAGRPWPRRRSAGTGRSLVCAASSARSPRGAHPSSTAICAPRPQRHRLVRRGARWRTRRDRPGIGTYTGQTFGPGRSELWTIRSGFHNVPRVGGTEQGTGSAFAAQVLECYDADARAELQLELSGAYPPTAGIDTWERRVVLERGNGVVVIDAWTVSDPGEVELTLMLCDEPTVTAVASALVAGNAVVKFDPPPADINIVEVELDDPTLVAAGTAVSSGGFARATPTSQRAPLPSPSGGSTPSLACHESGRVTRRRGRGHPGRAVPRDPSSRARATYLHVHRGAMLSGSPLMNDGCLA